MNIDQSRKTVFLAIIVTGFLLRLAFAVFFHPVLISDDAEYVALGKSLAHTGAYVQDGKVTAYRPPGYPFFLAFVFRIFGDSLLPVRIFQAVLDTLSCMLVFLLGLKLFSESVAILACGIFAFFPSQILYTSQMMTETVFTTLLLLFLLLCLNDAVSLRNSVLAGLIVGAGILVRPVMLLMLLVIIVFRASEGIPVKKIMYVGLLMIIPAILIVSPWLIRNYEQFGRIALASNTGVNFWMGNHSGASGSYSYPRENNPLASVENEFDRSEMGLRLGTRFIIDEPFQWIIIVAKKWGHFFATDYWLLLTVQYQPDYADHPAAVMISKFSAANIALVQLPFVLVLLSAILGFAGHLQEHKKAIMFIALTCSCWLFVHLVFFGGARFRFPIVPLLMIVSAYGLHLISTRRLFLSGQRAFFAALSFALFLAGWIVEFVLVHLKSTTTISP